MELKIIVTGPPRTGSSFLTRLINDMGYYAGPKDMMLPPDDHNKHGYYEFTQLNAISDKIVVGMGIGMTPRNGIPPLPEGWTNSYPQEKQMIKNIVDVYGIELYKDNDLIVLGDMYTELYPNAKWIYIGRDIQATFNSRFGAPIPFEEWQKITDDRFNAWRRTKAAQTALEINYEDFGTDPTGTIQKICNHLEITLGDSLFDKCVNMFQPKSKQ